MAPAQTVARKTALLFVLIGTIVVGPSALGEHGNPLAAPAAWAHDKTGDLSLLLPIHRDDDLIALDQVPMLAHPRKVALRFAVKDRQALRKASVCGREFR